jgi:hypothetical protein
MNAPERTSSLDKPLPLIIALVGMPGSGRKQVAQMLKHKHGFAVAYFEQPLRDAVAALYGVTPLDLLFAQDTVLTKLDKTPRQLVRELRVHAEKLVGRDFLTRRLVERTVARGEWHQQDLVVCDLTTESELQWLRRIGGTPWWIRRPVRGHDIGGMDSINQLLMMDFRPGDFAILNDPTSVESLEFKVDSLVERAKQAAAIVP